MFDSLSELLHTQPEPTTNSALAQQSLAELREKHDVNDAHRNQRFLPCERNATRLVNPVFLIDGSPSLKDACFRHGLNLRVERHGDHNSVERVFREVKRRTSSFQDVSTTPEQKLMTSGCEDLLSHRISLFEQHIAIVGRDRRGLPRSKRPDVDSATRLVAARRTILAVVGASHNLAADRPTDLEADLSMNTIVVAKYGVCKRVTQLSAKVKSVRPLAADRSLQPRTSRA